MFPVLSSLMALCVCTGGSYITLYIIKVRNIHYVGCIIMVTLTCRIHIRHYIIIYNLYCIAGNACEVAKFCVFDLRAEQLTENFKLGETPTHHMQSSWWV